MSGEPKKEKARIDAGKVAALVAKLQRQTLTKAVRGWIVTRDEPTADQRNAIAKYGQVLTILSLAQFESQLIDSRAYLVLRDKYAFGSVRDPVKGGISPPIEYIELLLSNSVTSEVHSPTSIVAGIGSGHRYVILGDYGAGKSMTLRWIYRELRAEHLRGATSRFPVYINLRDHYGQSDPSELLERHARVVGFHQPSHLVRAWRAGYVHLLLDGFDEVTALHIQGLWKKLQGNRYRAMEAVRRIVRDHAPTAGIALAGRAHFFDSDKERRNALGLGPDFAELSLSDFTEEQVREYFRRSGLTGIIPLWLPSRPLLVAYLSARGLLREFVTEVEAHDADLDPAAGWDMLLGNVAAREAEIEAGIDGPTVRRILERLSTMARTSFSGLGPITPDTVIEAFRQVCGYSPDEKGMVLLQRLPGLGIEREEEGTRTFIDEDFADACRAGDLTRFVEYPFDPEWGTLAPIECATGSLGIAIACRRSVTSCHSAGQMNAAIRRAADALPGYMPADLCRVAAERGFRVDDTLYLRGMYIPELELTSHMGDLRQVEFQDCFFSRIGIDADVNTERLPRFKACFVDELEGRVSERDLPYGVFDTDCVIESFAMTATTTDAVMGLGLPLGTRVLLTILKKLYQRRGSGRKESALHRGLDHHARRLVPDVLRLIQREGLATPFRRATETIWIPDRSSMRRVGNIIAAPTSLDDALLRQASTLA